VAPQEVEASTKCGCNQVPLLLPPNKKRDRPGKKAILKMAYNQTPTFNSQKLIYSGARVDTRLLSSEEHERFIVLLRDGEEKQQSVQENESVLANVQRNVLVSVFLFLGLIIWFGTVAVWVVSPTTEMSKLGAFSLSVLVASLGTPLILYSLNGMGLGAIVKFLVTRLSRVGAVDRKLRKELQASAIRVDSWLVEIGLEERAERRKQARTSSAEDIDDGPNYWVTGSYEPETYYRKTSGYSRAQREYIRDAYGDWDTYEANRPG
jgi:hypothetical protein